jgi:hypothetical protein
MPSILNQSINLRESEWSLEWTLGFVTAVKRIEEMVGEIGFFFFSFLGWGETESAWCVVHYLTYCTIRG